MDLKIHGDNNVLLDSWW